MSTKLFTIFAVLFLIAQESTAQNRCSSCRDFVYTFYLNLYGDNKIYEKDLIAMGISSSEWAFYTKKRDQLTQGIDFDNMKKVINQSITCYDGDWIDSLVFLSFPNAETICFQLSDFSPMLNRIWLPNGQKEFGNISLLKRPAIINDPDGYVNIREKPDIHSRIIRRIRENELFYFTPTSKSDWYPVYLNEALPCIGYIHKSRIKTYGDFPDWLKKKVRKMRGGC